jgi:hypothetical protein
VWVEEIVDFVDLISNNLNKRPGKLKNKNKKIIEVTKRR